MVGHKLIELMIRADDTLELWLDGCQRKVRKAIGGSPLYVWTNVELYWEEHRIVEARYFSANARLWVKVNGKTILDSLLD